MAKLILRKSCYTGVKNIKKSKPSNKPNHQTLVKQANKQIEKNRIQHIAAYKNAESYLK